MAQVWLIECALATQQALLRALTAAGHTVTRIVPAIELTAKALDDGEERPDALVVEIGYPAASRWLVLDDLMHCSTVACPPILVVCEQAAEPPPPPTSYHPFVPRLVGHPRDAAAVVQALDQLARRPVEAAAAAFALASSA